MSHEAFVHIRDLRVEFRRDGQTVNAVNGVSFDVHKGEVMALIGESGSGKSVTLRALMRLHPPTSSVLSGTLRVGDEEVLKMSASRLRAYRGARCAMIFQEPLLAFDPVYTVGRHLVLGNVHFIDTGGWRPHGYFTLLDLDALTPAVRVARSSALPVSAF